MVRPIIGAVLGTPISLACRQLQGAQNFTSKLTKAFAKRPRSSGEASSNTISRSPSETSYRFRHKAPEGKRGRAARAQVRGGLADSTVTRAPSPPLNSNPTFMQQPQRRQMTIHECNTVPPGWTHSPQSYRRSTCSEVCWPTSLTTTWRTSWSWTIRSHCFFSGGGEGCRDKKSPQ